MKRRKLFKKLLQWINKPYLVDEDSELLIVFERLSRSTLTEDRKWSQRRAKDMRESKHAKKEEDHKVAKDRTTPPVGIPDIFYQSLQKYSKTTQTNSVDHWSQVFLKLLKRKWIVLKIQPWAPRILIFSECSKPPKGNHFILHRLILKGLASTLCRDETLCDSIVLLLAIILTRKIFDQ